MKLKTSRGAAKRFKVTKSGRIMRHRAFHSHILTKKRPRRKRRLRDRTEVGVANRKQVRRLLGL